MIRVLEIVEAWLKKTISESSRLKGEVCSHCTRSGIGVQGGLVAECSSSLSLAGFFESGKSTLTSEMLKCGKTWPTMIRGCQWQQDTSQLQRYQQAEIWLRNMILMQQPQGPWAEWWIWSPALTPWRTPLPMGSSCQKLGQEIAAHSNTSNWKTFYNIHTKVLQKKKGARGEPTPIRKEKSPQSKGKLPLNIPT